MMETRILSFLGMTLSASDQRMGVRGSSSSLSAVGSSRKKESLVMPTSSRVVWR